MAASKNTDALEASTTKQETVKVRFVERSYGITAGETREVTAARADELVAAGLAQRTTE